MKIALVHDQLAEFGGAERVLIAMKKAFPDASVYTSFIDFERLGKHGDLFKSWKIHESFIGKLPFFNKLYSPLRFLLPAIWSSFDLSDFDIVLCSSSWGMCKGVSLKKNNKTKYLCYLHTPPRYLYGYDESSLKKYWPVKVYALVVNHFLRQYDYKSSQTIDEFIFNSEEIKRRSLKFYRKDGLILHPPIRTSGQLTVNSEQLKKEYYLTVSRLAPTKHIDLLIQVANEMKISLKIVGTGNQEKYLKSIAGSTVEFLGAVSDEKLSDLYANAKAFLYASLNEDFGMVPVEAMLQGTPVIALSSGGVKETVIDGKTGFTFEELNVESVLSVIKRFETLSGDEILTIKKNALDFALSCSEENFINTLRKFVIDNNS